MDLYALLGVQPDATAEEVKLAYRKLAVELHPDRNPDEKVAERFKEITAAYRTLSSESKRKRYDEDRKKAASPTHKWTGPPRKERGNDLRYRLEVDFSTGIRGGTRTIEVPRQRTCEVCRGAGAERVASGNVAPPCRDCDGAGRVISGSRTRACVRCGGRGVEPLEACRRCGGAGRIEQRESVRVELPEGLGSGRRLRLDAHGDDGTSGGETGDLFVLVTVLDHPMLRLDGADIECIVPVGWAHAMLGTDVPVPTTEGVEMLRVPPGTQDGAVLRMPGKGAPRGNGKNGDQLVHIEVLVPETLTADERKALEGFAAARPPESEPKVREYLAAIDRLPEKSRKTQQG